MSPSSQFSGVEGMQEPEPLHSDAGLKTLFVHDADWQIVPSGALLTPHPATLEQVYCVHACAPPAEQSLAVPPMTHAPPLQVFGVV